jgi:hypothetical protein
MSEPAVSVCCSECRRMSADPDAEGWRYFSDGVGELLPYCPACAEREFGLPRWHRVQRER